MTFLSLVNEQKRTCFEKRLIKTSSYMLYSVTFYKKVDYIFGASKPNFAHSSFAGP